MPRLNELTITQLSSMINHKEISVCEIVQEYFNRIHILDQGENGLNSVLEINPDALDMAKKLDTQQRENNSLLFGIPILIKDNINTADSMHTSAGSLALADSIASSDADIVKSLREKGAVILGKTNMTEFANHMTRGMPPGYSSRGGQVKSPFGKEVDPSGSSTGSAVAVSANLCMASIGTDTAGSIISPGIKNSIVGFRPSMGAISQKGIIPICFTFDTAGPMTRTVADSCILFSETTGARISKDDCPELKGIMIGMNELALKDMEKEEVKKAESIVQELEKAGIRLKRLNIKQVPVEKLNGIRRYEFKFAMNNYLSKLPKEYPIRNLKDIVDFNNQHREQTLKFGQFHLVDALENTKGDLSEPEYMELLKERERHKKQIYELFRGLDACIMFEENLLFQYIGLPVITIPSGLNHEGLPYGFTLTALTDTDLLKHACSLEKVVGCRVVPKM